ncbi:restriction endonuclease subunit S [Desulfobulbus sp. US4]|nr:restriction endonuclease subunit S [Desulfobulbus sp. US4]
MRYRGYPAYKESGVEWLGEVPEGWKTSLLKRYCKVTDGSHYSPKTVSEGRPYISVKDVGWKGINFNGCKQISEEDFEKLKQNGCSPKAGDVLLTKDGTIGRGVIVREEYPEFVALSSLGLITPFFKITSEYLLYYLLSGFNVQQMLRTIHGSALTRLTVEKINDLTICIPPYNQQTAITNFLDRETKKIDTLITKQQKLIKLLQEKRQAVISHAVTKGLNPNVKTKDSGVEWLGEMPEHWDVTRAKFVSNIFVPQRNKPALNDESGIPWVTMEDMHNNHIQSTRYFIDAQAIRKAGSKILKAGSVIASCVGNLGIASIVQEEVVINQQLQAFIPKKINAEYLRELIVISKSYFEKIGTAATVTYVNQEGFENLPVLIPPKNEQSKIEKFIISERCSYDKLIKKGLTAISLLQERRTALISAAVTGKIDVRTPN